MQPQRRLAKTLRRLVDRQVEKSLRRLVQYRVTQSALTIVRTSVMNIVRTRTLDRYMTIRTLVRLNKENNLLVLSSSNIE